MYLQAASVHGDISQAQRTRAVEDFKSGAMPLLIATDVAARGLDIPDVEAVINYSFPLTTEDYVHRIGRTGRAGKSGQPFTILMSQKGLHPLMTESLSLNGVPGKLEGRISIKQALQLH